MSQNRQVQLIDLAPRTGVYESSVVDNPLSTSGHFILYADALSTGQRLTLEVIGVGASGLATDGTPNGRAQYTVFTSLPIVVQGATHRYVMGSAMECVPGIACRDFIPRRFFIRVTPYVPAQTDTYSVDLHLGGGA